MKTIYLIMAHTNYEGSDVVCAFEDKNEADIFLKCCENYEKKRPQCPEIDDTPENNLLWDKFHTKIKKWEKHHPAGMSNTSQDSFGISEIELR